MEAVTAPVTDVRDISKLAYGFMASKALFVALEIDVFGRLAGGAKTIAELASETGIVASRLRILLTACVSVGLLSKSGDGFAGVSRAHGAEVFRRLLSLSDRSADLPNLRAAL
jgi:hypothetical protein